MFSLVKLFYAHIGDLFGLASSQHVLPVNLTPRASVQGKLNSIALTFNNKYSCIVPCRVCLVEPLRLNRLELLWSQNWFRLAFHTLFNLLVKVSLAFLSHALYTFPLLIDISVVLLIQRLESAIQQRAYSLLCRSTALMSFPSWKKGQKKSTPRQSFNRNCVHDLCQIFVRTERAVTLSRALMSHQRIFTSQSLIFWQEDWQKVSHLPKIAVLGTLAL